MSCLALTLLSSLANMLEMRKNGWGGTETLVLEELISPKNSKIPRRNQGIANGGVGVIITVVLERERRSEKNGEGVSSIQVGLNP
jgi:hypothetical protein